MSEEFRKKLYTIINEVAGAQVTSEGVAIDVETLFNEPIENRDIDSITFLEIIMAVEDKFDITLAEVDPDTYRTFADVETDLLRQIPKS